MEASYPLHRARRAGFLLPIATLIGVAATAHAGTGTQETTSPFSRLHDAGPGRTTIAIAADAYARLDGVHRGGEPTRLVGFPMPDGASVDLLLRPTSVMAEGASAVVHGPAGETEYLSPTVRTFAATLPGRSGRAFLAISPTQLNGYVRLEDGLFFVSSGGAPDGQATVTDASTLPSPSSEWCRVAGGPLGDDPAPPSEDLAGLNLLSTKVFFECDNQFRARFSSDQQAIDYVVTLVAASSEIYRRDLGVIFNVPSNYIVVYNSTPPWGATSGFGDLGKFVNWWNSSANPNKTRARAAVSLLTSPVFGGVANSLNTTCVKNQSYQISSVNGSFPTPLQHTAGGNWDPLVVMHEIGHLYGSSHTFEYSPPIQCIDGSGPDSGTIMSYCHLTYGTGAVGMRFHPRVQDSIRPKVRARSCPRAIPIQVGDYDYDGDHDAADLAEFDAYMTQGFVSRGSEETFDMDLDGDVDARDRDVLVSLVNGDPPASAVSRGAATCLCIYYTNDRPLIGQTWTGIVAMFVKPVLTVLIGTTAPQDPGLSTKYGELLIGLPPAAAEIFRSSVTLVDTTAYHSFAIPYDISLIGGQAYSQALVFTKNGPQFTNAVDLVLGVY